MRVLVIGSGAREHAMAWKLRGEGATVFCTPGNPGTAEVAVSVPQAPGGLAGLADWAQAQGIDVAVVGPEAPLAAGAVDVFERHGLRAFGPCAAAAELESSKVFMKQLCRRYGIPTAAFQIFDDPHAAVDYVRRAGRPLVVKADGLAAGKGVTVAQDPAEAAQAIEAVMVDRRFGDAGARVVVEEVLVGAELSAFAFCDGRTVVPLLPARDHKRLQEGDAGPNTGGMGAFSPVPSAGSNVLDRITDEILEPVVWAMAQEGRPYRGVLFAGVMLTADGPQALEFNVRFGDPEAQVLLPLLASPLLDGVEASLAGSLDRWQPRWLAQCAVCVVLACEGYPDSPRTGSVIRGVEDAASSALVFHAGTAARDGRLVSSGGRILSVVGLGTDLRAAGEQAYRAADRIHYGGKILRRDIGRGGPAPAVPVAGREPANR
jgi:phosphoribosylamine---glycine ligase